MGNEIGQAWINFFYFGANAVSLLAAFTGFIGAWMCLVKIKDFLGRDTRQHAKASSVIAWFLVAGVGLSFASFVQNSHDALYQGTGVVFGAGGNPVSWRVDSAASLGSIDPQFVFMGVILIGFSFLGVVSFFLALLTLIRFDTMHPKHDGAIKDFFMYVGGGVVSTNLAGTFKLLSHAIPFLRSTSEMLEKAQSSIFL